MAKITAHFDATHIGTNDSANELRLYFRWDKELPLDEIVGQLNNFEQINITLSDRTLIIEY